MKKTNTIVMLSVVVATLLTGASQFAEARVKLPVKRITCDKLGLQVRLNSHHITFEAPDKSSKPFEVEVDESIIQNEEIYLNYLEKKCINNPNQQPDSCVFHFAAYKTLPDGSVPESTEFIHFDFINRKIVRLAVQNGQVPENEVGIPEQCISLAKDFVDREDLLNQMYSEGRP
jgi:hypothetical protein